MAGNAKDLENIFLFGKSDTLSRKSECFRFVVVLKTQNIELWDPFNRTNGIQFLGEICLTRQFQTMFNVEICLMF